MSQFLYDLVHFEPINWASFFAPHQIMALIIGVITIAMTWLAGSRLTVAWYVALVGNAVWYTYAVYVETWTFLPLVVAMTITYTRNLVVWRRRDRDLVGATWVQVMAQLDEDVAERLEILRSDGQSVSSLLRELTATVDRCRCGADRCLSAPPRNDSAS